MNNKEIIHILRQGLSNSIDIQAGEGRFGGSPPLRTVHGRKLEEYVLLVISLMEKNDEQETN